MGTSYYGTNAATGDGHSDNIVASASGTTVQQTTGTNTFNTVGYLEILSQGGTPTAAGALPSTGGDSNSGGGWYDKSHLLSGVAVPAGVWSIKCNIKASDTSNPTGTLYAIFWDLNDLSVVYTYIGTSTGQALTITNTSQEVTLSTASLGAYTFGSSANNGLFAAIWWHQTSGGTGTTTISVSVPTSATIGVTGDNGGLEFILPSGGSSATGIAAIAGTGSIGVGAPALGGQVAIAGVGTVTASNSQNVTGQAAILGQGSVGVPAYHLGGSAAILGTGSLSGSIPPTYPLPTIPPPPMPLISLNAPAYSNTTSYPPSNADDGHYGTTWNSAQVPTTNAPVEVIYDLSHVPVAQRQLVVVNLLNEIGNYRPALDGNTQGNLFQNYTLAISTAAGGPNTQPAFPYTGYPADNDPSWTTVVSVTGNDYPTRQHIFNMNGANWLRFQCTAAVGSSGDCLLQMDVHDAHVGIMDRWLVIGDSWTQEGWVHGSIAGGDWGTAVPGAVPQVVSVDTLGNYYPAMIAAGDGGMTYAWAVTNSAQLLDGFSGGFVILNFGVNDCNTGSTFTAGDGNVTGIYNSLLQLIDQAAALNNVVIWQPIPWTPNGTEGANAQLVNAYIRANLPAARPHVLIGPDLWTFFNNNPSLIRTTGPGANLHPTFQETTQGVADGYEWMHSIWAQWMTQYIYQIYISTTTIRHVTTWGPNGLVTATA